MGGLETLTSLQSLWMGKNKIEELGGGKYWYSCTFTCLHTCLFYKYVCMRGCVCVYVCEFFLSLSVILPVRK